MAISKVSFQLLSLVFLLFFTKPFVLEATLINSHVVNFTAACIEEEKKALLKFKLGLKDPAGMLSSWVGEDYCKWMGISCSNQIGNVIKLSLSNIYSTRTCLSGELDDSLLNLTYLNYLDLSYNSFNGIPIPSFIGSLKKLRYLDLSHSSFGGMVPHHLGNLSNLLYLDLTTKSYPLRPWDSDLNWLGGLSSLQYLSLGGLNLSKAAKNWLLGVNMLPSLLELHLDSSELDDLPQFIPYVNFTSLLVFDLSYNNFNSSLPQWLFNISTLVTINLANCHLAGSIRKTSWVNLCLLQSLDLFGNSISGGIEEFLHSLSGCSNSSIETLDFGYNQFSGNLPESLGSVKYLDALFLTLNSISGALPMSIGNLSHLSMLDLSFNVMNSIPESIGQLAEMFSLDLWENKWKGVLSEIHLHNLTRLKYFALSSKSKSLALNVGHDWIPLFSLSSITIINCQLGPSFPLWLRTQKEVSSITLSNNAIVDAIPDWLWTLVQNVWLLDLSTNQLTGKLPQSIQLSSELGITVNLDSNYLEGSIPLWRNATSLYLGNNRFSGQIPWNIGQEMTALKTLDLSRNYLNGSIPPSISRIKNLIVLVLSRNDLSENIPWLWKGLQKLNVIDLSENKLQGNFPSLMWSQLPRLFWLKLSQNNLSGELSLSLRDCATLFTLDLGGNRMSGTIPEWVGENLTSMSFLLLGANIFTGNIPEQLCQLPLKVLDLSQNNILGSIPKCLGNLEVMKDVGIMFKLPSSFSQPPLSVYLELIVKGRLYEYYDLIGLLRIIDLSSNNLLGEIPGEITNLST
ncbi:putative non-specific serine/threonine protein kinase [Rosa chinensis]|uniref:Putative non-specific serine/threonine protein kinase n=1 Tax=Rosa chinensis TaxID=74649 RepID=A0A2P6RB20_ROSCH|nr:putative non-specific serine/threonine protein kinase [Rosa chinensis]